ncbi:hypothetical protein IFM89_000190 [Coptis chinensis]|uniref:EF-hand domain-containing protein n=1 Tax=Coptis chinensis TaxID=261450 RepID=A0A835M123_9MAGN|nr:hypothetical protein IFM89_000190 [Coptis chinensis]
MASRRFRENFRWKNQKEKARNVIEKLGLIGSNDDENDFEFLGNSEEEWRVEEVVGEVDDDELRHTELLQCAFTVFDENGDGFIEALEVKRVLECLGLANGCDIEEFEKMVEAVDLNFDGKAYGNWGFGALCLPKSEVLLQFCLPNGTSFNHSLRSTTCITMRLDLSEILSLGALASYNFLETYHDFFVVSLIKMVIFSVSSRYAFVLYKCKSSSRGNEYFILWKLFSEEFIIVYGDYNGRFNGRYGPIQGKLDLFGRKWQGKEA